MIARDTAEEFNWPLCRRDAPIADLAVHVHEQADWPAESVDLWDLAYELAVLRYRVMHWKPSIFSRRLRFDNAFHEVCCAALARHGFTGLPQPPAARG